MLKIAITIRKKDDDLTYFINKTYLQFLSQEFEIELVLPRIHHNYQDIVKRNDALLITGGDDINPIYYKQELGSHTHLEDHDIELMDFALIHQFYQERKPIIGICRGIQVINVFFHGTLFQDIPTYTHSTIDHRQNHSISIIPHTTLSQYFPSHIQVNSLHHQSLLHVSPLLTVNAMSEDGIIEGVENKHILAVQWHPERMDKQHQRIFLDLMLSFIKKNCSDS